MLKPDAEIRNQADGYQNKDLQFFAETLSSIFLSQGDILGLRDLVLYVPDSLASQAFWGVALDVPTTTGSKQHHIFSFCH